MKSKKCLSPVLAFSLALAPTFAFAAEYERIQGTLFEVVRKDGKVSGYKPVPTAEYQQAQQLYQSQTGQAQGSETVNLDAARSQYQSGTQTTQTAPIAPVSAPTSGGGGASAAKGSQAMQIVSIGASVATAGLLVKPCGAVATSAWACPMLAMSLAQAASLFGSQSGAGKAASAISSGTYAPGYTGPGGLSDLNVNQNPNGPGGSGTNPNGINDPTLAGNGSNPNGTGTPTAASPELQQYLKEYQALSKGLEKAGYKLSADGKSVVGPDGKKTPTSAFNSPEAMQAAGFGMDDISAMSSTMAGLDKKIADKLRAVQMSADGAGGGGAGGGGYAYGGGGGGGSGFGKGAFPWEKDGKGKADSRGVAGMMKKLGDDNIGVAADNIFEMIQRRYKARDEANNFLK